MTRINTEMANYGTNLLKERLIIVPSLKFLPSSPSKISTRDPAGIILALIVYQKTLFESENKIFGPGEVLNVLLNLFNSHDPNNNNSFYRQVFSDAVHQHERIFYDEGGVKIEFKDEDSRRNQGMLWGVLLFAAGGELFRELHWYPRMLNEYNHFLSDPYATQAYLRLLPGPKRNIEEKKVA